MTGILIRSGWTRTRRPDEGSESVLRNAVTCLQAKPRDTSISRSQERGGTVSPSALPRRNQPCLGLDFGLLASWTIREEYIYVALSHPVCGSPRNPRQWHMERRLLYPAQNSLQGLHPHWLWVNRNLLGDPQMTLIQFLFIHSHRVQTDRYSEPASGGCA